MLLTQPVLSASQIDLAALENLVLPNVFKPARYIGIEQGAYRKSFDAAEVHMAVAFPDLYEIGVSNYGLKLLYSLVNQYPKANYLCDRVYAPAPDMKEELAKISMPLYGVETLVPLYSFDLLAFTLQYELNYSSILGLLESAQIPFRSKDRASGRFPLLIAGGPGSGNPMPLAPFFDAFIIGDGEEVLIEMLDMIAQGKRQGWSKATLLEQLATLEGIFIPGVTEKAYKRIVDIAENPIDIAPLIPAIQAVHDRVVIEARRGCDRMCRFCQPCFINLPVREQGIEQIKKSALAEIEKTGYEECSLLSLSIADYSYFKPMVMEITEALQEEGISLSLPSQRADRFSIDVAEAIQKVRKSTLTFAPEAGTKRLRDVINKNLSDAEILNAVTSAYRSGWNKVKLYFIIGLPTETLDDLDGIINMVKLLQRECGAIKREPGLSFRKHLEINITLSNFVPKPHTPFQWFAQDTMETLHAKIRYIKDQVRSQNLRGVKLNFTDPEISKLEAFISKGGPEVADILELAYRKGAYLDAWDDVNNFQKWFDAIQELGPGLGIEGWEQYTRQRCCAPDEPLPWDAIDVGLNKSWLKQEYEKAKAEAATVPCFEACSTCGVCANYNTWPKFIEEPKKSEPKKTESKTHIQQTAESLPVPDAAEQASCEQSIEEKNAGRHKLKREPVAKLRLLIEKQGAMKFISHLDWLRMIHRAVSRAKLPVAYSQGFNPKPKVAFSPALPLFSESTGEFVDVELSKPLENIQTQVIEAMNAFLPDGARLLEARDVPLRSPSIDKSIRSVTYQAIPVFVTDPNASKEPASVERLLTSFKQATCQDPLIGYTEEDRLHWLQEKTAPHRDAFAKGDALNFYMPLEFGSKVFHNSTSQTRPTPAPKHANPDQPRILNLTPYLQQFSVLPSGRLEFRIKRLSTVEASAQTSEALSTDQPDQVAALPKQQQPMVGIKPSWVLNFIDPNIKWSLIRTDIELEQS